VCATLMLRWLLSLGFTLALTLLGVLGQQENQPQGFGAHHIIDEAYAYLQSHECSGQRWGLPYHFYRPSLTKYSADQWLWDSCAHMITWSHRNVSNAVADLRTMLSMQRKDGRIPEIIFWSAEKESWLQHWKKTVWFSVPAFTDLTQMPLVPFALRAIWQKSKDTQLMQEMLPKIVRYCKKSTGHQTTRLTHSPLGFLQPKCSILMLC
jgi:hypothetical protein